MGGGCGRGGDCRAGALLRAGDRGIAGGRGGEVGADGVAGDWDSGGVRVFPRAACVALFCREEEVICDN